MNMMNNLLHNPQMVQMALNSPQLRQMDQNNPNMKALLAIFLNKIPLNYYLEDK
jgi:hypothetical protein